MINNGYYNPYNQFQQQPQYQFSQAQSFQQPTAEFKFMTSDEVKGYIVDAGRVLYSVDRENMKFFVKRTDNLGVSTIETYSLTKIDQNAENSQQKIELDKYVTKDNLTEFKAEIDKKLDNLSKQIKVKNILAEDDK